MTMRLRNRTMHADDLQPYLAAGPSERVAYLPAKSARQTVAETLAAMANAGGGIAILGVTAKGTPQALSTAPRCAISSSRPACSPTRP